MSEPVFCLLLDLDSGSEFRQEWLCQRFPTFEAADERARVIADLVDEGDANEEETWLVVEAKFVPGIKYVPVRNVVGISVKELVTRE